MTIGSDDFRIHRIYPLIHFQAPTGRCGFWARDATLKMWNELNREDLGVLELLQQGRLSPAFDGGRLSPHWEGPTHDFGRRVIEKILS